MHQRAAAGGSGPRTWQGRPQGKTGAKWPKGQGMEPRLEVGNGRFGLLKYLHFWLSGRQAAGHPVLPQGC